MKKWQQNSPDWVTDVVWFLVVLLGVGSCVLLSNNCDAQEIDFAVPCAPEVTGHRSLVLPNEDQAGIWFHLEIARCMLGRLAALPELQVQLRLYEERRDASEALEGSLRRRGDLAVEEAETARGAIAAAVRARQRAEEDAQSERDLRWLWVGGSALVVIVLEIVAIWVFSQVRITI